METTLVLVKPDGVQRGLVGEVVRRFETKGLQIVGLKMVESGREPAVRIGRLLVLGLRDDPIQSHRNRRAMRRRDPALAPGEPQRDR